jgi:competence protein ComEA
LERVRELVGSWRGDPRIGFAMLVCVAVVAGVVWYRVGVGGAHDVPPRRVTPTATNARLPAGADVQRSTTTAARDLIVVHVAGAVTRPGVVELDAGARVIDAVEAAGGAVPEADLDRLNLAAKVADGERILVSRVGDPPAVGDGTDTGAAGSPSPDAGSSQGSGPINLNTATLEQLDALPGIGPVLAQAILDERIRRGRFRSVQELREVRGIGEKRFADLADRVTV